MVKKRTILFIFAWLLIFPMSVQAADVEYTLFDSTIQVNQDRTLDVSENYHLYFIENTKSISRTLKSNLVEIRPDQSSVLIQSKIDQINSKSSFHVTNKNQESIIQIDVDGSQDETGLYDASYHFNLGKDTNSNYDELYYDIVSNVDAIISNLTFTIKMPNGYDKEKVKFAIDGKYNLTDDDLEVIYEEDRIIGTLNRLLEKNQTFSVRMELKDGYFIGASDNFNYWNLLLLILPVCTFLIVLIYWIRYAKGNKLLISKIDKISDQFDPAEIGYLYKGHCEEVDLIANIIHLANQGYIRIEENDDGYKLGKENSFRFIKLRDYEKNNACEKLIFDHLFRDSDVADLESIEYHFADKLSDAKHMLDNSDNYKKLYFKDISIKKIISIVMIAISTIVLNFKSIYLFTNSYWLVPIVCIVLLLSLYILFISNSSFLLKFILGFGLLGGSMYLSISSYLLQNKMLLIYIIGMLLILLSGFIYKKLPVRTKYGNKVLGDCYSIKKFIETMSISDLKKNIEENPMFYFDIVPYACVLDSLSIWTSKGKEIIENPPEWYLPSEEFNLRNFEKFIKNVLYTTAMVMMKRSYSQLGFDVEYKQDRTKTNLNS